MRLLIMLTLLLTSQLLATENATTCKGCHPTIYTEFQNSFHKKSSIKEDKVHSAMWNLHPAKAKGNYKKCAECHTPNNTVHEGITCVSCHSITSIENHSTANKNIYESKPKTLYSAEKGSEDKKVIYQEKSSWLGMIKETTGSPYHNIDYTNKGYYTGKMCMGCHSHKQNSHDFDVCRTEIEGAKSDESNCITCHMPQIQGSSTSIKKTKTHAFHSFAGVRNAPQMLSKHINLAFKQSTNGFELTVHNDTPHALLSHPLRVVELKTVLKRDGKKEELKIHTFVRTIGHNGKPSMPWLANQVIKDTMIKANEKRMVAFDTVLKSGDELEVILGYRIINSVSAKKLGLEKEKELVEFTPLKRAYFSVE